LLAGCERWDKRVHSSHSTLSFKAKEKIRERDINEN
jgi:hypothetical protein